MSSTGVRACVRLTPEQDRLGEWLADASAFDAAGADAIWVELGGDSGLDPLAMVAALAVVTSGARLVLPVDAGSASTGRARTLDTIRRLSHDRLALLVTADERDEFADFVPDLPVLVRDAASSFEGRGGTGETERWLPAPTPTDRTSWSEICSDATERGAAGVVVDAGPVLLDILRNPTPWGDRREVAIAQG